MRQFKPGQLQTGSIYNISSSYALTASYALNGGTGVGGGNYIATGSVTASVSLGTGSFTITSGSSTFMFVSSSGNVGFGTTTPSQPLTVNGVISAGATGGNLFTTVGGGISSYGQIGSNYYYTNSNTAFRKFNDFVSQLDFGSGGFYFKNAGGGAVGSSISFSTLAVLFNGGNFVVGSSTDAGYRLDVNGTARIQGNTLISSNNQLQFGSSFNNISSQGNAYLEFTNRAFKGVVLYNGQSIAESQKLLIGDFATYGIETSRYTSAMLIVESSTRGFLPPRTSITSNISSPGQGLITYVNSGSNEGLYYYNSGSAIGWHKVLTNSGSQAISGSLNLSGFATGSILFTSGSAGTVTGSSNLFWDDANNRFIIGGSTASNVRANTNEFNVQRDGLTVPTNGNQLMFNLVGNGTGMSITNQNATTYRIGQFAVANMLTIGPAGTSALNVNTTGNVLINTTTDAGYKLDVNGTARVSGTGTTSATTAFYVQNSAGTQLLRARDYGSNKYRNYICFGIGKSSNRFHNARFPSPTNDFSTTCCHFITSKWPYCI